MPGYDEVTDYQVVRRDLVFTEEEGARIVGAYPVTVAVDDALTDPPLLAADILDAPGRTPADVLTVPDDEAHRFLASPTAVPENVDAEAAIDNFVRVAESVGLPVQMLRDVRRSGYSINPIPFVDSSEVYPWVNFLFLENRAVKELATFNIISSSGPGPGLLYHEATHAYLDLRASEPRVEALRRRSVRHYAGAPLEYGGVADDPERLVDEAAATYVQHRVATWLRTLQQLSQILAGAETVVDLPFAESLIDEAQADYDQDMAQRVFGYQKVGGFVARGGTQQDTTRAMPDELVRFLDREVLEWSIPHRFADDPMLVELAGQARERIRRRMR